MASTRIRLDQLQSSTFIPSFAATASAGSTVALKYDGGNDAINIDDANSELSLNAKNSNGYLVFGSSDVYLEYSNTSTSSVAVSNNRVSIFADALNSSAIRLGVTANNTAASGTLGYSTFTTTSGDKYDWRMSSGYAPTSGTGTFANLYFNPTINQTGGASGATRAILIDPTLTAAADWRAIELANTSGKSIYQTSASATNNFAGSTALGTTSSPHSSAILDIVSTTKGLGVPSMTTVQRDAISSPRDGLLVYDSTTDLLSIRANGV